MAIKMIPFTPEINPHEFTWFMVSVSQDSKPIIITKPITFSWSDGGMITKMPYAIIYPKIRGEKDSE